MKQQFSYFIQDVRRMLGKRKIRILYIWMSRSFWGVLLYRMERGSLISLGKPYEIIRILFLPIINLIQAYSNLEIHYKANIKGGLYVLHPSMGIVISGKSVIESNLTLTGGNVIGVSKKCTEGEFVIGNNCNLGANAVILGPVKIGNNIKIGALSCVTKDFLESGVTLVGIPAKIKIFHQVES
ncbi:MAG: DapH/DapD/GlmU-related protein [Bacteroidota bacterium]